MEQVNDIINNLCDKLGTTVEYLAPEYAKMKIADARAGIVVAAIIFFIFLVVFALYLLWLRSLDYDRTSHKTDEFVEVFGVLLAIVGAACVLFLCSSLITNIPAIYRYNASPVAALFEDVMNRIH